MSEIRFTEVSLVTFTDDDIRKVANLTGRDEDNIREFLAGKRPDPILYHAFHYVTGCYPISQHRPQ
jgi:hypothetical protein